MGQRQAIQRGNVARVLQRNVLGFELKAMPDGTELKTPISTTTLNTAEMTDYQNRLQAWAAGNFGLIWEF